MTRRKIQRPVPSTGLTLSTTFWASFAFSPTLLFLLLSFQWCLVRTKLQHPNVYMRQRVGCLHLNLDVIPNWKQIFIQVGNSSTVKGMPLEVLDDRSQKEIQRATGKPTATDTGVDLALQGCLNQAWISQQHIYNT